MATSPPATVQPLWLIDLHGMVEALTSRVNSVRASVISAIQSGEMLIIKSVSAQLKALYPHLWGTFSAIKPRKYAKSTMSVIAAATQYAESYGSSLLGSIPMFEHFEAVALAEANGCRLVSASTAHKHCRKIVKKCALSSNTVATVQDV
ncbi:hypothetical protein FHT00_001580 [Sphingomonas insulae]|uniref:Uncharacterized protein n=1 Tax=Sphingomonas insulae TaxID=424800 RepID=A0ABN1HZ56_9SPHN|nr:hypothetical protein [Sphingomonas insulae]NIJ29633.1 hypothetical protein [Sphingomonas insulae]